jgi:hypothetical protein
MAVRDTTGNMAKAAEAAKMATVNFNKRGEMQSISALYLFFNPAIQGTATIAESLLRGEHKAQGWAMIAVIPALAALAMMQWDDEEWERLSEVDKKRNMLIRTGKDTYVKIPLPYGHGYFYRSGQEIVEAARGKPLNKVSMSLAEAALEHFGPAVNPLQGGATWDSAFIQTMPTVIKMAGQAALNKGPFGQEMVPGSQWDEGKPDNQRMFRTTKGTVYAGIASGMNRATGGTDTQKGFIDVSPETLKYWWNSTTGGAGRFWADSSTLAFNLASGRLDVTAAERSEVPFLRGVADKYDIKDLRSAYYTKSKEAKAAADDLKRAAKAGDIAALKDFEKDKKLQVMAGMAKMFDANRQATKALRDNMDAIMLDETKTLTQKRQMVKQLEAVEAVLYDKSLDALEATLDSVEGKR